MEIKEIKQQLSIITVLNHYGYQPDKNHRLSCPFHPDKTPSMQVYEKTNTVYCFSSNCKTHGKSIDVIDFIMLSDGNTKHEAILKAQSFLKYQKTKDKKQTKSKPKTSNIQTVGNNEILTKLFKSFQNGLGRAEKPKGYLQQRNLDYTKLETGYNSGQFHHHNKLSEKDMQACIDAGLLIPYTGKTPHAKGQSYTAFAKDCIIFPLKNKKGEIVSLYGRSILESKNGKHFYLKNRTGLYPKYPPAETTKLILTEAIIDAATLLQTPETLHMQGSRTPLKNKQNSEQITKNYEILSLYGTNGLTPEHSEAIKELPELKEIIFFFDGDEAGKKAIEKYKKELSGLLPHIKLSAVETPENEDINSLLDGHEAEILTHLLENRKVFSFSTEKKKEESTENQQAPINNQKPSILNVNNPDYITFTTTGLQIIILGGINLQQLDRLRITIKISRTDTNDPLHSIRHTLDLYHSDYLEKFINKASEQLETGTNILRRAIAELTDQMEQYRLSKIESLKEQKLKPRELSPGRSRKAINYLKAPRLMGRTNKDIGRTGMVGEENNRLLMYLVFTSRLREQPLHIISLGGSGTGKTYLQEKISELIPEQDKLEITILSENAFYYFGQKELKHKLVLIEDMDGAQDVLYPLRELQSKKRISKTIPIKDSKGNMKTITLKVEGPICLAGTTTRERLYEDNSNRSLLIFLDNRNGHKEQIMEYQRKLSAGKVNQKEENKIKEFFKDMQTVLKPVKVRNPYAEYLKLPGYIFKPLRTNSHYLATIETITFYHQYQREIKTDKETGERYIETILEDIEWANKLLKDVLLAKADELPRAVREFFERLKDWLQSNNKEVFYNKEIRENFRITSSSCNRYILELLRNNYIKITGGNKYRKGYEYQIIKPDEYQQLQQHVKNALDEALENIKKQYPSIPTVSQKENGILKEKKTKELHPVSQ